MKIPELNSTQLRLERNYGETVRLVQDQLARSHYDSQVNKAGVQAWLALMQRLAGDTAGAKVTAEQARNTLEQSHGDQPDIQYLGLVSSLCRNRAEGFGSEGSGACSLALSPC